MAVVAHVQDPVPACLGEQGRRVGLFKRQVCACRAGEGLCTHRAASENLLQVALTSQDWSKFNKRRLVSALEFSFPIS